MSSVKVDELEPDIMQRIMANIQGSLNQAAEDAADMVRDDIETGANGIDSDTGGAVESIYSVMFFDRRKVSGYGGAVRGMTSALIGKYTEEHVAERVFEEVEVDAERGVLKSVVASSSLYLGFWEVGHENRFLGQKVYAPHFSFVALKFGKGSDDITGRFRDILRKR